MYCFNGGPCDGKGTDLMFTELGDKYYVKSIQKRKQPGRSTASISTKGIQTGWPGKKNRKKIEDSLREGGPGRVKQVLDENFELPYWDKVFKKCLGCGICTYVCPTCHCFDIFDYVTGEFTGDRFRCWDSCMFPDFTLMAGGHNPRPSRKERVRNRFMHKLKYHLDRYNLDGCVGCGRCISKCPVNIDITQIIKDLKEVGQNA